MNHGFSESRGDKSQLNMADWKPVPISDSEISESPESSDDAPRIMCRSQITKTKILEKKRMKLEEKFLVFACFVFVIALAFFLFITHKEQTLIENQQQIIEESDDASVGQVSPNSSPQPKPESENPEPTKQGWQAVEEIFSQSEASERETELAKETKGVETEKSELEIRPELEALFIGFDKFREQKIEIEEEVSKYYPEFLKLQDRLIEMRAINRPLSAEERQEFEEEFNQGSERLETLRNILTSIDQRETEIENEFHSKYGTHPDRFGDLYGSTYKAWRKHR